MSVVVDVDRAAAAAAAAVGQSQKPESSSSRKRKRTADFWRACRYLAPHRRLVIISIICAFLVGLTFASGLGAILPVLRILVNGDTLQSYAGRAVAQHRLDVQLADTPAEVKIVAIAHPHISPAGKAGLEKYDVLRLPGAGDDALAALADPLKSEVSVHASGPTGERDLKLPLSPLPWYYALLMSSANALPRNMIAGLAAVLGFVGILTILGNAVRFFQEYYSDKAAMLAVNDLRRQLYDHVLHIPLGFFGLRGTSDVTSRLVQDAGALQEGFKTVLGQSIQEPIKAAMAFAVALWFDWHLTLFIVLFGPLMFAIIKKFGKKMRRASKNALQKSAAMLGQLEGTLIGIRVVKAGGAERFERRRYRRIMHGLLGEQLHMSRIDAFSTPVLETLTYLVVCAIVLVAAYLMQRHTLSATRFMGLMACLAAIGESFRKSSKVNNALQKSGAAAARIFETLDVPVERPRHRTGAIERPRIKLPPVGRQVRFENVTFSYANVPQPAVRNLDLTVPKGQCVAVVGRNGSGKTTLLALLPRFYEPQQGRITIDGIDIRDVTLRSLRKQIGIVTQEAIIFPGTIAENIAYGHPLAGSLAKSTPAAKELRSEIEAAAKRAFAHDFIHEKPDGYDTVVGEHGAQLSGGQRQRLCIARAILRRTPILILDEATSQVDAESEHLIQQAIEGLMHERTTFVIAHRFSTIQSADTIIVLERGEIIGQGKHADLLKTCDVYKQLYERQSWG
jgi:ABC-type multidrug transport system fused ATPase/permease subunit